MRLRQDYLTEQLQNEEFKVAYDEWEPDFEIADALLRFRADKNLTQAELAKLIGINRSDLSKLESASANPTLKTLKKIASALEARLEIKYQTQAVTCENKAENSKVIEFFSLTHVNWEQRCDLKNISVSIEGQNEIDAYIRQEDNVEPALALALA